MYQSGERSPWAHRIDDQERFKCFKRLCEARGARYAGCTLDTFSVTTPTQRVVLDSLRGIQAASDDKCSGLILYGPEGTGKDHLQFAMLRHAVIECGWSVAWRDGMRLQDEIRKAIRDDKEPELREALRSPHVFAISDPLPPTTKADGALNDWNLGWLRDVIDRRYQDGKATWLTFNGSSLDDLKPVLTPPLAARVIDSAFSFHCNWKSYRKALK